MEVTRILVVFDPTTDKQPALARAHEFAREEGCEVLLFSCIHSELPKSDARETEVERLVAAQKDIVEAATAPLVADGLKVTVEVEWKKDWYQAVVDASARYSVDAVFKASHRHSATQRLFKKTSDWTLIRQCECAVLLVKSQREDSRRRVLVAVDLRRGKDTYEEINKSIFEFCKHYSSISSPEIHFLNAYKDLPSRPDRGSMIRACGVESEFVHIKMGEPGKVIVESANELDVDLVVIGNSARTGLAATVNNNTAELVLDHLQCDLLVIP
ncbi:MAG: universal stress protein [Halioglobus sp.]